MLLRKVSIAGFKSIRNQDFELGRLNVLIGQNGAGKSNILEAIGMLSSVVDGGISFTSLRDRGVRLSAPTVYRSALKGNHRPKYFDLSAQFDDFRYHCNVFTSNQTAGDEAWTFQAEKFSRKIGVDKWKTIAGRSGSGLNVLGRKLEKSRIKATSSITGMLELLGDLSKDEYASLEILKSFAIYTPSIGVLRGVETDSTLREPLGLYGGGLPNAIRQVLSSSNRSEVKRFFSALSWFRSLGVERPDPTLKAKHLGTGENVLAFRDAFMNNEFNKLYSFDVSEGALYVAFVLALMLTPNSPKFFALDNVDSSLNPGLVRNLMGHIADLVVQFDKQVILTSHNPSALDALDLFNPEHFLYVVDRGEKGETELTRLAPPKNMSKENWTAQFGDASLSEMWLNGLLGGITPPTL